MFVGPACVCQQRQIISGKKGNLGNFCHVFRSRSKHIFHLNKMWSKNKFKLFRCLPKTCYCHINVRLGIKKLPILHLQQWFPARSARIPGSTWEISRGTPDILQSFVIFNLTKKNYSLGVREFYFCFTRYVSKKWLGIADLQQ